MILSYDANPGRIEFSERTTLSRRRLPTQWQGQLGRHRTLQRSISLQAGFQSLLRCLSRDFA